MSDPYPCAGKPWFLPAALGLLILAAPWGPTTPWAPSAARAEMCRPDVVPAATVLLPYFEVDYQAEPGTGVTTSFTLHNALPEPALGHVTVWTDWSIPVLDFDLYLTGYDRETLDLYQVLALGNLPITADQQSDPGDTISPGGLDPAWEGSFGQCDLFFPFFVNPLINGSLLADLRASLTGGCTSNSQQKGSNQGDGIARGFITVDAVRDCSIVFPSEVDYFTNGVNSGIAIDRNQFWGDWTIYDPTTGELLSAPLVHIEADPAFEPGATDTGYTFYGRYTQGHGTSDHREPLASVWGGAYFGGESAATSWIVWRDPSASTTQGVACGSAPDWLPLQEASFRCFDQQETDALLCQGVGDPACFPLVTQRVELGSGDLSVPWDAGWCLLDLSAPDSSSTDVDFNGDVQQGFVLPVVSRTAGDASVGEGVVIRGACQQPNGQ